MCGAVYTEQKFYAVTGLRCSHHADI